ncbi:MAG: nickel pincer cofactor biosynthesis protein LarC [Candidatus Omnitrophica bacterium]|nr:nickel pincer cofactor biosynthesis protein LarC [Candidatus Omnitrophota bacterium]
MIGFFDIRNGCAGDMICAALAGCVDTQEVKKQLNKVSFPSAYEIEIIQKTKQVDNFHRIKANQFLVHVKEKERERTYSEILSIFENSKLAEEVKQRIIRVFNILAEAESIVHREDVKNVHFHAIGQTDALIEVSFSVLALDLLGIKKIVSTPIGISNAAPATAEMMKGIPVIIRNIPFEITTPTGIAIIKAITDSYDDTPIVIPEGYSYGTGSYQTELPNTLQFIYGKELKGLKDTVCVIETSVDDMNPIIFDYLLEKLYQVGAFEVCFFPGITKKTRPIFWIRILCRPIDKEKIFEIIFKETTTLGIRYREEERILLKRLQKKVKTKFGEIRVKVGYFAGEVVNLMPEYEDCKKIATEKKVPLKEVMQEALRAWPNWDFEKNGL